MNNPFDDPKKGTGRIKVEEDNSNVPDWARRGEIEKPPPYTQNASHVPDWAQPKNTSSDWTQDNTSNNDQFAHSTEPEVHTDDKFLSQKLIPPDGVSYRSVLPMFILLPIAFIFTGILFGLTCYTLQTREKTAAGAYFQTSCSDSFYKPLRVRFSQDPQWLMCSWKARNSAIRFIVSFFGMITPFVVLYALRKKRKLILWLLSVLCLVMGGLLFWCMIIDAEDVRSSQSYCTGGLTQQVSNEFPDQTIICSYWPYALVVGLDCISFLAQVLLGSFTIRHVWKFM